jgi:hypothetical protein
MYFAPFINTEIVKMIKKAKKKSFTIGSAFAQNGGRGGKITSKRIKGSSPAMAMSKRKPQVGFMTFKDFFNIQLGPLAKDMYKRNPNLMEPLIMRAYEDQRQEQKTKKNIGSKRIGNAKVRQKR